MVLGSGFVQEVLLVVEEGVLGVDAAVGLRVGSPSCVKFGCGEDFGWEEGSGVFGDLGGETGEVALLPGGFGGWVFAGEMGRGGEEKGLVDVDGVWEESKDVWVGVKTGVFVRDVAIGTWLVIFLRTRAPMKVAPLAA